MKQWTEEEINLLKKNYPRKLDKEISEILGRSIKAVSYMSFKLNLKKDYDFYCLSRKKYEKEFSKEIFDNLYLKEKKSIREIAFILGIGRNTADHYLKKYNFPKRNKSEASKLRVLKYTNWNKGLNKKLDKRIFLAAEKSKRTSARKRKKRIMNVEEKFGKPLKELIKEFYWSQGFTQEKVAKQIGFPKELVVELMKRYDIKKRPNFEYIANLKGERHAMFGKTWEDLHGLRKSNLRKKEYSNRFRKLTIMRLENNEFPFFDTKIELKMAKELSRRNIPFVKQFNINNKFVCDFAIPFLKIIIECDGDYWHSNPNIYKDKKLTFDQNKNLKRDRYKDNYLKKYGWVILRFYESDIKSNISSCIKIIEENISTQTEELKKIKSPIELL